ESGVRTPDSGLLQLRNVNFSYRNRQVLFGIQLEVRAAEIVALLGPNGSGKSTLLAVANGALKPQSGEVLFEGQPVAGFSRREAARRMALVAQASEIRFPLTALEYVLAGRFAFGSALGFDSPHDLAIAVKALEDTDAVQFTGRKFNELSSGERQRVVLARALAQEPRLLLLDEPTANADIAHQISLLNFVRNLTRDNGLGALVITHEINLAAAFADRIALLKDGRLLAAGQPPEVMTPELLGSLFGTPLLVDRHPRSGKPRISWISPQRED
ncbi:MAG: ABC transporter ATP-binding protein, partial [Blastocatellia bacterium]|nr:ABC transporter ATP-binding protein [Blastocatellia bacterium]